MNKNQADRIQSMVAQIRYRRDVRVAAVFTPARSVAPVRAGSAAKRIAVEGWQLSKEEAGAEGEAVLARAVQILYGVRNKVFVTPSSRYG